MNQQETGAIIRQLREKKHMTQAELAQVLYVTDKTVSKWESGKGFPDLSLLESIAGVFDVSVSELLSGKMVSNVNISANMLKSKFYVCPVCGNVIHSMGEAVISCHGVQLAPCLVEESDENHMVFIEGVEDEYYVRMDHEMSKKHYISFAAALSPDRLQLVKLYPEGNAEARFQMRGVKRIFFCCNRDGLYCVNVHRAIDGRQSAGDDSAERKSLEQMAQKLFG